MHARSQSGAAAAGVSLPAVPGNLGSSGASGRTHRRHSSMPTPNGIPAIPLPSKDGNSRKALLAHSFKKKVEQVMADKFARGGKPAPAENLAQLKAKQAAARHQRYHVAVKRGRDPRTFSRNEGPLWSTVSQLDNRLKKASVGAPLHRVLDLTPDNLQRQAPINDSLNMTLQPVKHAAAAIQYMGATAYKDTESQYRHLKGNIEAHIFGESTINVSRAQAQKNRVRNERLVPNFNPDTDLASATSTAKLYFGSFVMLSLAHDDRLYLTADYENHAVTVTRFNAPEGQRIFQVVNLNNLDDSSPVGFKQKVWLKIYEQKRRMKIDHNGAEMPYLERRGSVIGTTLRHYSLPRKVKEAALMDEPSSASSKGHRGGRASGSDRDSRGTAVRRSVPTFINADFSVMTGQDGGGGRKSNATTRTRQLRHRYNSAAQAVGKWRLMPMEGDQGRTSQGREATIQNGDVIVLEQDNLSLASNGENNFCQAVQTETLQLDVPLKAPGAGSTAGPDGPSRGVSAGDDEAQRSLVNSERQKRLQWRVHLVQPHDLRKGESNIITQGDKAARLLSKARHQINQSERYRNGNVRHETGLYSGATFSNALRDKLKRIGMAAEDRFITAHHRNVSFLSEHFQPEHTKEPPATSPGRSRSTFAERVRDMKARLHDRDAVLTAGGDGSGGGGGGGGGLGGGGVLLPDLGNHPFFADDVPVRFENHDEDDGPWLGDVIDNSYTRDRFTLPLIDDALGDQIAAERAARIAREAEEERQRQEEAQARAAGRLPPASPGRQMFFGSVDASGVVGAGSLGSNNKPVRRRKSNLAASLGKAASPDKKNRGRRGGGGGGHDVLLDNIRVAHSLMGDFGRAQLVSRGRTSTPAGGRGGNDSDESPPDRNRVDVIDTSTTYQFEYALHQLSSIDTEVANIDLLKEVHPDDAFPVHKMNREVKTLAKQHFKMPKPRRLPEEADFLHRTQDAQL